ncbi:MAG TPA: hypothetical protein VFS35_00880 [Terrimicrobiaceae bacterium]|nr:hypothetical protein [Terrimicrobiaceae bacterium]
MATFLSWPRLGGRLSSRLGKSSYPDDFLIDFIGFLAGKLNDLGRFGTEYKFQLRGGSKLPSPFSIIKMAIAFQHDDFTFQYFLFGGLVLHLEQAIQIVVCSLAWNVNELHWIDFSDNP